MAQLQICKYCEKDAMDSQWHQKCRAMALEDLLYRTQKRLHTAGDVSLGIAAEILNETFRSKEEMEREFERVEELIRPVDTPCPQACGHGVSGS